MKAMAVIAATTMSLLWAASTSAHDTSPDACQVEDWRWWQASLEILFIEGVTTCTTGEGQFRVYDGAGEDRKFVGIDTGIIEGHIFMLMISNSGTLSDVSIEYSITPRSW